MNKFLERFFPSLIRMYRAEGYENAVKDILILRDKVCFGEIVIDGDNSLVTNMTALGGKVGIKTTGDNPSITQCITTHCDVGMSYDLPDTVTEEQNG